MLLRKALAFGLLTAVLIYLGIGVAFHFGWERAQASCRAERIARGEFVEPEVFHPFIGLFFDLTYWPVYAAANFYHDGTVFATPCTH